MIEQKDAPGHERIRDVLRLTRAHTAPSEMFGCALAAYVGGVVPADLWMFVLLGWFVHNAGFGMNSLVDYLYGYDMADPSKTHHPLVAGRLSVLQATVIVFGFQLGSIFYFFLLAHALLSQLAFGGYIVFGWAYNLLAKKNKWAAMAELGISMGLLFFACATVLGHLSGIAMAASVYVGLVVVFQIGVCGDLKDLTSLSTEVNILRQLGTRVTPSGFMETSGGAILLSDGISFLKAAALAAVAYLVAGEAWCVIVLVLGMVSFLAYSGTALRRGTYQHAWRLKVIGAGEVWGYVIFVIALFPLFLSWAFAAGIFFFILPVAYFYGMNRMIWPNSGSGWAPGV